MNVHACWVVSVFHPLSWKNNVPLCARTHSVRSSADERLDVTRFELL